MITRIEISTKVSDTRSLVRKAKIERLGYHKKINQVNIVDVYTINKNFSQTDLNKISTMLTNPVTQNASSKSSIHPPKFTVVFEIGFLPGVTDNVANTAKEMIEDLLKTKFKTDENVYTSQITFINGQISKVNADKISESFYNPIIQRVKIKSYQEFIKDRGMGKEIPLVKINQQPKIDQVNLDVSDNELIQIGKSGIVNHDGTRRGPLALDLTYLKTIREYFKKKDRNPTDIELESIAQTWSEHCKHTIFADPIDDIKEGLYEKYIKKATEKIRKKKSAKGRSSSGRDFCVSVFTDNSGAIKFDQDYLITDKVETHNSPSALDPFGGAITGIVGVNRDAIGFGLGAKPIINRYGFCFAEPNDKTPLFKGSNFTQKMLEPRRIMDGVIEGVNSGGNCSGIPTPQGFMFFDRRYKGKPLVFVGTVGLIPNKIFSKSGSKKSYVKKAQPGDYIVMVGGRVGIDGIHGATFSSEAMDSGSPATAVQIGDPITQKKLSDAIIKEARNLNLYHSITDNGAGGLSCSVAEMAKESGGCLVNLDLVPLKYPGLAPWQIWISESQERMTLAVPKNKWNIFSNLMKIRGVEATIIGEFTQKKQCLVKYHDQIIMDVDMKFLHDGLPKRVMKTTFTQKTHQEPRFKVPINLTLTLKQILKRPNIAGQEFLSMQYDHEVQGGSVLKPIQGKGRINSEATIVRPLLTSSKGVVVTQGICPTYSDIDTYHMAACSIDTAIRNAVAVGANIKYLALLDNFCWCSCQDPERLGQLKRAAKACFDYTIAYQTPLISGKDSMFNDFKGFDRLGKNIKISIPPTLLISSIGVIDEISKSISIDLKFPGDLIYILGETNDELGGSEYFSSYKYIGNAVPQVDARKNKKLYTNFYKCVKSNLLASAISVGRGGLGVALTKTAMAGDLGLEISLKNLPGKFTRDDFALFSESQGRIIVSINPKNKARFESFMKKNSFACIGYVTQQKNILIKNPQGNKIIDLKLKSALESYKSTFEEF